MSNASGTHRQITDKKAPVCPTWCHRHEDVDIDRPGAFRVHRSRSRRAGGYHVQLERTDDFGTRRGGRWVVLLDDTELTRSQAVALSGLLAAAAGETL